MRREKRGFKSLFFIIYIIFGVYFLNQGLSIWGFPEGLASLESALTIIGGVLLIIGAINVLRIGRLKQPRLF